MCTGQTFRNSTHTFTHTHTHKHTNTHTHTHTHTQEAQPGILHNLYTHTLPLSQ